MDRVRTIIGYEWRAYWRRFSRAGLQSNQGIILLLSALVTVKYLQLLRAAAANVASGNSRLLVQLLTAVFLVWLFPLATNRRETLGSPKWLHLPLSLKERFLVRAISMLLPPSAWLALAGSVAILYPLANARNPGAGVIAGLLFIATAWLTGLTIAHLLNSATWRLLLWIVALASLAAAGVYVIRGGASRDLLSLSISPAGLVVDAAMANWKVPLAIMGILAAAAGSAALWSFQKSLAGDSVSGGRRKTIGLPALPGRLGGLVAKDFIYFRRLLDTYLGLAAAMLACLYLVVAEEPSAGVFWSFIIVVFLCNAALAFNSFGLDNRAGLDRYMLLPLNGRAILLSKNIAYLTIVGVQLLPMFALAAWRLGATASAFGLIEAAATAFAYLAWGNWMSVSHPLKMQFFRFANSGAALVDEMGGMVFGSLPGIAMIYLLLRSGSGMTGGISLILLLTSALYLSSLSRFGRRLELKRERIAEALG